MAVCSKVGLPDLEHTTDPGRIAEFLALPAGEGVRALFATYQSQDRERGEGRG